MASGVIQLGSTIGGSGTGTVTSVDIAVPAFLTASGGPITSSGTITLSYSGTALPILNGGTGATTANTALNAFLPSQTSNSGKFLTTDGTNTSWGSGGTGTVTSVAMTVPAFLSIAGSPVTTSGTLAVSLSGTALPVANGGTGLTSGTSGGILAYSASGTLVSSGALTASQLIIGGGAGVAPSTLAAGSQYQVLRMGAANPAYGSINLDQSAAVTGVLPNANTTAASANTASAIVARDGSGNFTAGTITASLTGNASTATALSAAWSSYTPTFTGFGTVTVQSFYSFTLGKIVFIHGSFTAGTSTATEGRVSLPVTSSANIATINTCGMWIGDGPSTLAGACYVLMEPSKAYVTFGYQGIISANAKTKQNANVIAGAGSTVAFTAMIPID